MPFRNHRVVYVTQRCFPTEEVFYVDVDRVDPLILDLLEKRFPQIIRIAVMKPTYYDVPLDAVYNVDAEEETVHQVLGDEV